MELAYHGFKEKTKQVQKDNVDLEHFTKERHVQTERTEMLKKEIARVTVQVNDETTKIKHLGEIMSIIKECSRHLTVSLSSNSSSLELFFNAFEKLQNEYSNEFALYCCNCNNYARLFKKSPPIMNTPSDRFNYDPYKCFSEITMTPYENQLIMPKLTREVDFWNPNTDKQMIHQWLYPWLSLLRKRIEPLYLTIHQKFRSSL
ncbi:unnamed protein product [Rhizophagus irregularis]|nr:unnamed protein product [Rhizophagus irregularis]